MAPTTEAADPLTWQQKLTSVVDMVREMSLQTDPQAMVRAYGQRMNRLLPADRRISLSRRGLVRPDVRITRHNLWKEDVNPWKEPDQLPLLSGGLLSELIYGDQPRIIDDLQLNPDDPAAEYLEGQRSLMAVPLMDEGVSLNMVVLTREQPRAFDPKQLPEVVWMANLFGRATHNLVLADQLRRAYELLDRELKLVGRIQQSLLPRQMPDITTMRLSAYYQTSQRAGGDYYDFFPLADGKWGLLIADVAGHGTPAAVMMAIIHSIAHTYGGPEAPPSQLLRYLNDQLISRYHEDTRAFTTAFYGIYDTERRHIVYSSAGHPPPLRKHCAGGVVTSLDQARALPLGIAPGQHYEDAEQQLYPGDQLVFYTDGVTEAANGDGVMFGTQRLEAVIERCRHDAGEITASVLEALSVFTNEQSADDDRTLVVAKIL